jgi:hypothetical protein
MANVTITLDDGLLQSARLKAVREGTSVNAVIRAWLERWVEGNAEQAAAVDAFLALARANQRPLPERGWSRDDLHER